MNMPYETISIEDLTPDEWQSLLAQQKVLYLVINGYEDITKEWLKFPAVTDHIKYVKDTSLLVHPEEISSASVIAFHVDEDALEPYIVFSDLLNAIDWSNAHDYVDLWLYMRGYLVYLANVTCKETDYRFNKTAFSISVRYFYDGTLLLRLAEDEDSVT
jgi:hypothetical protein